jgi:hypothetical protein
MVADDIPDDSNTGTDVKGLAAMTAQILNFPGQQAIEETAPPVASDYVKVAGRLIESASVRGYDLTRLARAIMSAVETQEREARAARTESVKRQADYGRTPLCLAAREACTELMNAYKRNNSDTMTDYYDVNFSGDVVVD